MVGISHGENGYFRVQSEVLAVLERVRKTGQPVLVTRFGKPVAQVGPTRPPVREDDWLGSMRDRTRIVVDILSPVSSDEEWEARTE
jgi:antitoxin (DNA-binding transcriptional repressor) of toxin-antitoxin stability system